MIHIKRSRDEFEYELRALVMAYYHGVKICTKPEVDTEEPIDLVIDVTLGETEIGIAYYGNGIL